MRGVVPGAADPDADVQGHVDLHCCPHLPPHELLEGLPLPRRHLEHQLVVHLEQDARAGTLRLESGITPFIASLMMSAADPWIGALSAIRSAPSRR